VSEGEHRDDPPQLGELIERLNTGWRIAGPEASRASLKQRLILPAFRSRITAADCY